MLSRIKGILAKHCSLKSALPLLRLETLDLKLGSKGPLSF